MVARVRRPTRIRTAVLVLVLAHLCKAKIHSPLLANRPVERGEVFPGSATFEGPAVAQKY